MNRTEPLRSHAVRTDLTYTFRHIRYLAVLHVAISLTGLTLLHLSGAGPMTTVATLAAYLIAQSVSVSWFLVPLLRYGNPHHTAGFDLIVRRCFTRCVAGLIVVWLPSTMLYRFEAVQMALATAGLAYVLTLPATYWNCALLLHWARTDAHRQR